MLSIQLDPETEKRLSELAKRTGRSEDDCARELIEEHIDDLEDRYLAELRLKNRQPLRVSLCAHQDARSNLDRSRFA